jgi:hypothetical protein
VIKRCRNSRLVVARDKDAGTNNLSDADNIVVRFWRQRRNLCPQLHQGVDNREACGIKSDNNDPQARPITVPTGEGV